MSKLYKQIGSYDALREAGGGKGVESTDACDASSCDAGLSDKEKKQIRFDIATLEEIMEQLDDDLVNNRITSKEYGKEIVSVGNDLKKLKAKLK